MKRGKEFHAKTAVFEVRSRSAVTLGWWLVVAAVALVLVLVRG